MTRGPAALTVVPAGIADTPARREEEMASSNLGQLVLNAAERHRDHVAFQVRRGFRTQRLTFAETAAFSRRVAWWLGSKGLQPGDRVAVWSPNMPEYALLYFGAWLAGLVVVPIDVRTQPEVRDRYAADAGVQLAFQSGLMETRFAPRLAETVELESLLDRVAEPPRGWTPPDVSRDQLAEIAYTSGTTGVPKGVMLTHGNLLAEVAALTVAFPLKPTYRALSLLPLSHVYEQVVDLLLAFSAGVSMTYLARTNPATILHALQDERITCLVLVPEVLRMMLAAIERRASQEVGANRWRRAQSLAAHLPFPARRLLFRRVHRALGGHLVFIGCASAPLDAKLASAWERLGIRVFEAYGLTEVAAGAAINSWHAHRLGSVGRPLPSVEVRIAEGGEILVKGPTVTPGYFDRPDLTAKAIVDGWFHTGDVGFLDSDGFLHVSGREAFRIVLPDGRKVYPEDVERVLDEHPLVRESCVVGLAGKAGESVHAVLLTDAPERAGEVIRDANRRLGAHQQITGCTVWPEANFPRTPILKVDRGQVAERVGGTGRPGSVAGARAAPVPGDPLLRVLSRIAEVEPGQIRESSHLQEDLGLDSIARLEVLAGIEEEVGVSVPELEVGPQTTVADLRRLAAAGGETVRFHRSARRPRARWARLTRRLLLWLGFRVQDRWMQMEVVHAERAERLPLPSILISRRPPRPETGWAAAAHGEWRGERRDPGSPAVARPRQLAGTTGGAGRPGLPLRQERRRGRQGQPRGARPVAGRRLCRDRQPRGRSRAGRRAASVPGRGWPDGGGDAGPGCALPVRRLSPPFSSPWPALALPAQPPRPLLPRRRRAAHVPAHDGLPGGVAANAQRPRRQPLSHRRRNHDRPASRSLTAGRSAADRP